MHELDHRGRTPLMHATFTRSAEAVAWLVARRADLEAADGEGCTALHMADTTSLAALLVHLRASVDARDARQRTPLGCVA